MESDGMNELSDNDELTVDQPITSSQQTSQDASGQTQTAQNSIGTPLTGQSGVEQPSLNSVGANQPVAGESLGVVNFSESTTPPQAVQSSNLAPQPHFTIDSVSPAPKAGKKIAVVFAVIIALLIVGAGSVYAYRYSGWFGSAKKAATTSNTEGSNSTTSVPENFLAYKKPTSPLAFYHPKEWQTIELDEGKTLLVTDSDLTTQLDTLRADEYVDVSAEIATKLKEGMLVSPEKAVIRISLQSYPYTNLEAFLSKYGGAQFQALPGSKVDALPKAKIGNFQAIVFDSADWHNSPLRNTGGDLTEEMVAALGQAGITDSQGYSGRKIYYINTGESYLAAVLYTDQSEKYGKIFDDVVRSIQIAPAEIKYSTYNKNGLSIPYPTGWDVQEEWTGRNKNLGEISLMPTEEFTTAGFNSIRVAIRPKGSTEIIHTVPKESQSLVTNIAGSNGTLYWYLSDDIYQQPIVQQYLLAAINDKHELGIWNENGEVNKPVMDKIISQMKIDQVALDSVVAKIKPN